ncbi:late competence development ComFB family protein [Inediibacterium massiliense]|uniref:late competence development ComFB family protein n=1 Tax=Inediibacterium massiliense TaxID=1658111 RepID=UPI0006B4B8E2|nr:competence protein ComFB [Inediibacterium massiliense]
MPKNYMEDVVNHLLPSILENFENICLCKQCVEDIKALALNHLSPLYVSSSEGYSYAKSNELDRQFQINVTQKIVEAIEIVQNNKRHD